MDSDSFYSFWLRVIRAIRPTVSASRGTGIRTGTRRRNRRRTFSANPGRARGGGTAARARDRTPVAFLGSANLVRGSMNLPVHCGLLPYDEKSKEDLAKAKQGAKGKKATKVKKK